METMGKLLEDAQREYESLVDTMWRQLEIPLEKIDTLRKVRGTSSSKNLFSE